MANINNNKLKTASAIMRAIAHPLRLKLLSFIDKNKVINVNKIYKSLDLEQSITSQHLKILREASLVKADRKGKFIFYNLNYNLIKHVNQTVQEFFTK